MLSCVIKKALSVKIGIFKGALEGRARQITEEMKLAAAEALAAPVSDEELNDDFIMPEAFDPRVSES